MQKVEKDPVKSEDNEEFSDDGREKMKIWFQENVRMIVSVAIVVLIAGGIYSYSKRTEAPVDMDSDTAMIQEVEPEGKISVIGGETEKKEEAVTDTQKEDAVAKSETAQPTGTEEQPVKVSSQETGTSFVETAAKGDGSTNLARRALANYLEKNPDSTITAEQKIYIEDMLRRQVKNGRLKVGDSREFSKDMIAKAIEKSKGLNEKQLRNLSKYVKNVPDLK